MKAGSNLFWCLLMAALIADSIGGGKPTLSAWLGVAFGLHFGELVNKWALGTDWEDRA